jgi:hypothetical protein
VPLCSGLMVRMHSQLLVFVYVFLSSVPCQTIAGIAGKGANIMILDPPVISWVEAEAGVRIKPGSEVVVRMVGVDAQKGYLHWSIVAEEGGEIVDDAATGGAVLQEGGVGVPVHSQAAATRLAASPAPDGVGHQ